MNRETACQGCDLMISPFKHTGQKCRPDIRPYFHLDEFKALKQKYPALDSVLFFRKPDDEPFGVNLLYKSWKKACKAVGIYDVDLYGGTRHSSITAIAKVAGKDKARKYSGHLTNKAFDRYCQIGDDDTLDISHLMAKMRGKVVPLKPPKSGEK